MSETPAKPSSHRPGGAEPAPHGASAHSAHGAHHRSDRAGVRCAIVTVSDTRSAATDGSGNEIGRLLAQAGHQLVERRIVRDDPELVREAVAALVACADIEAVITNGGTGIAPRDNTYEAVSGLLDKRIDGFGELFRMLSFAEIGAAAMLSRAVAGMVGSTALFCVPGSTAACRLAMERLILPELGHVVGLVRPAAREGSQR